MPTNPYTATNLQEEKRLAELQRREAQQNIATARPRVLNAPPAQQSTFDPSKLGNAGLPATQVQVGDKFGSYVDGKFVAGTSQNQGGSGASRPGGATQTALSDQNTILRQFTTRPITEGFVSVDRSKLTPELLTQSEKALRDEQARLRAELNQPFDPFNTKSLNAQIAPGTPFQQAGQALQDVLASEQIGGNGKGSQKRGATAQALIGEIGAKQARIDEIEKLLASGRIEVAPEIGNRLQEFESEISRSVAPAEQRIAQLEARNNQITAKGFGSTTELEEVTRNKAEIEALRSSVEQQKQAFDFATFKPGQVVPVVRTEPQSPLQSAIASATKRIDTLKAKKDLTAEEKSELETNQKNIDSWNAVIDEQQRLQTQRTDLVNRINTLPQGETRQAAVKKLAEFDRKQQEINETRVLLDQRKAEDLRKLRGQASIQADRETINRVTKITTGNPAVKAKLEEKARADVEVKIEDSLFMAEKELDRAYEDKYKTLENAQGDLDIKIQDLDLTEDLSKLFESIKQEKILEMSNGYLQAGYDQATAIKKAQNDYNSLGDEAVEQQASAIQFLSSPKSQGASLAEQFGGLRNLFGGDSSATFNAMEKFYSPDIAKKAREEFFQSVGIGQAGNIDEVLASGADDATMFDSHYKNTGRNVQDTFNDFKDRVGEPRAKQIKQGWLVSKGWDEESIQVDDFTDDIVSVYSGENTGQFEVPALVKKMKSAGMPDSYIASQLEIIKDSPEAHPLAVSMASGLLTNYQEKPDIRGGVKEGFVQIVTDEEGKAKVVSLSQGTSNVINRASAISSSTGGSPNPTYISGTATTEEEATSALSQFPQDIILDAEAIMNPTSSLRLSDISQAGNRRAQVAQALNVLKDQAINSGDTFGVIRASAGGKDPDATTINSFEKSLTVLSQLDDLKNSLKGEKTGPIVGILRSNNPFDVKARQIQAQLTAIIPNLARGTYGEVGVLTDNDVRIYQQTIPNLTSQEELAEALLGLTLKTVQRGIENKIRLQAGLGRDMSGIESIWSQVKSQADNLIPATQTVDTEVQAEPQQVDSKFEQFKSALQNNPQAKQAFEGMTLEQIEDYYENGYLKGISLSQYKPNGTE